MSKCVTTREMRQLEELTMDFGICEYDLMCSAGFGAGRLILDYLKHYPKDLIKRVVILCGGGKNGGDGFVIADFLQENSNYEIFVYLKDDPHDLKGISNVYFTQIEDRVRWVHIKQLAEEDFISGDIIIDCLTGIGCSGELTGKVAEWVNLVNSMNYPVIAIDLPSGLNGDTGTGETVIKADYTISIGMCKQGLVINDGINFCGKLSVTPLGIPEMYKDALPEENIELIDEKSVAALFKRRPEASYKNSTGNILILGGSSSYPGAAMLCAAGALRSGCGMVHLAYPTGTGTLLSPYPASLLRHKIPNVSGGFFDSSSNHAIDILSELVDFVIVGPGIGRNESSIDFLRHVLKLEKPLLIDADALTLLGSLPDAIDIIVNRQHGTVLTPHHGELRSMLNGFQSEFNNNIPQELTRNDSRIHNALLIALNLNCIVVHKGNKSVIATPDGSVSINSSGSPALATAGSGDVLSGVIGGLAASGEMELTDAVKCGVFIHGRAGENQPYAMRSLIADDLPELIALEMKKLSPFA